MGEVSLRATVMMGVGGDDNQMQVGPGQARHESADALVAWYRCCAVLQGLHRPLHVHSAAHGARQPAHQVRPAAPRCLLPLRPARQPLLKKLINQSPHPSLLTSIYHPPVETAASLACLQPDDGVDRAAQPDDRAPRPSVRRLARGRGGHGAGLLHQPLPVSVVGWAGVGWGSAGLREDIHHL